MQILKILKNILTHPFNKGEKISALIRFFKWQIISNITDYSIVYPLTRNSLMIVDKGMTGITGCIYNGLLEFEDMFFILHFLRQEDLFIDVGSNVGVYTILASAEVSCNVISVEPINKTFKILEKNVLLNNVQNKVAILNIGIGNKKEHLRFSSSLDTVNHVISKNEHIDIKDELVEVDTLDNIILNKTPSILKIDVEGYESNVIEGAKKTLLDQNLKAIIIELNGSGDKYGFNDNDLHKNISEYGFSPYLYNPYSRELISISHFGKQNTIYIRDYEFVNERIKKAKKIQVQNKLI